MILLVVYVGAVAVLFLFVVMMLDIDFPSCRAGILEYAPIGALIGIDPRRRADRRHWRQRDFARYRQVGRNADSPR